MEIPKTYNPKDVEDRIYKQWEESGFFNPDNSNTDENAPHFTISLPPPNATGTLHTGHAVMLSYQDAMIRYNRLLGKRTLWVPGTDHASIATQTKVEKLIQKEEKKTRHDLGREDFLKRVESFVEDSRNTIRQQLRKMGSSLDWSRERYTLDEGLSQVVKYCFKKMYDQGVLYRGKRIVNWCPRCQSTLADDEVEYEKEKGKFYWLKYGPFTLATARPETKLGDTAVAVHPDDKRYTKHVGKKYMIPGVLGEFEVMVVADKAVDPEFGTGVIKVTPAHSFADFDIAQRHGIPMKQIINENGKMMDNCGKYAGMTTAEARKAIVADMEKMGLIDHIDEDYEHNIAVCYRCGEQIEPIPSLQWFVDVNKKITLEGNKYFKNKSIKEVALQVVKDKEITILPERFERDYFRWLDNLRDWCISRQIWFGHRIPVWYKGEDVFVGLDAPKEQGWEQDTDTLDTWFSSGLWTFSTLMDQDFSKYDSWEQWIDSSPDLKAFHPTSVMETGYDILFFWVARMIIQTTFMLGDIPFEGVYLHGLVRDEHGRKMSKSLGNTVDPLDLIPKFGTDALRMAMISGTAQGADTRLYDEKIQGARNFVNKLWNISRYIFTSVSDIKRIDTVEAKTLADQWILSKLSQLIADVTKSQEELQFSQTIDLLKSFTWEDFADWYIEISKIEKDKDEILLYVLERLLILWHPLIPFVTEELWKNFNEKDMLMIQKWPKLESMKTHGNDFDLIQNIIRLIRNIRSEFNIDPSQKLSVQLFSKKAELLRDQEQIIKKLARLETLDIAEKGDKPDQSLSSFISDAEIYVRSEGIIDTKKEKKRISQEIEQVKKFINQLDKKLGNTEFTSNAPKDVVEKEQQKHDDQQQKLDKLQAQLKSLG